MLSCVGGTTISSEVPRMRKPTAAEAIQLMGKLIDSQKSFDSSWADL